MDFVNMVSGRIGGAVSWTVDSSWGLGYWHSLPSSIVSWFGRNGSKLAGMTGRGIEWCWDNRVRQLITSAGFAFALNAYIFFEGKNNGTLAFDFSAKNLLLAFIASSGVNYLWETKLMWYPLDGAVAKGILASGTITTLDALSIAALFKGMGAKKANSSTKQPEAQRRSFAFRTEDAYTPKVPKGAKKCGLFTKLVAVSWIVYRCADIGLEWGNASHGLVRLNFDPTLSMWSRVQSLMPSNVPAVAA